MVRLKYCNDYIMLKHFNFNFFSIYKNLIFHLFFEFVRVMNYVTMLVISDLSIFAYLSYHILC